MIEFDVETTSLQHHGEKPCEVFLAQFGDDEIDVELHYRDGRGDTPAEVANAAIRKWLERGDDYRAWNSKFDLHCLKQAGFNLPDPQRWHDGMVAANIIDERRSAALQARADAMFGDDAHPEYEDELHEWILAEDARRRKDSKENGTEFVDTNYSDVPRSIMDHYGGQDILNTRAVSEQYMPQIRANVDFSRLYDLEMDVMRGLWFAEDRGIPVDREALVNCEAAVLPKLEKLEDRAIAESGFKGFNPRSPKQVGEALERLGANTKVMDRTKTKQLVTDEENLLAVNHPLGDAILAYRGEEGIYKWLRGALHGPPGEEGKKFPGAYLTSEDRLHPNFRQLGARTGRMSCSNPNFQNVPRDDLRLRYAIKADPGHKLVACDLDGIEMVLLAAFAGEGPIMDAIRTGKDMHKMSAERVGLTGRKRATGDMESPRQQGKRLNYMIVYGGGKRALKKWFGVDDERAGQILDSMTRAYPEVYALQSRIEEKLEDRGYLESPLTHRRWRMYGSGYAAVRKEGYRFLNYLIQGTAADILKIATARIHKAGIPIVALVHDEVLAHVPTEDAEEAGRIIVKALTEDFQMVGGGKPLDQIVPITADAQIVDRWSDCKEPGYVPDYAV